MGWCHEIGYRCFRTTFALVPLLTIQKMFQKSDKGDLKQISSGSTYHNNFWVIFAGIAFLGGGGVGVLRISSERDDRRTFFGLKFSVSGFLWVITYWQVFFGAAWFSKDYFGVFKTIWRFVIVISFNALWKFLWLGNSAWDFFLLNFGLGVFWVLFEALGIFLRFDFCPLSITPVTWNPEYPPWDSNNKAWKSWSNFF